MRITRLSIENVKRITAVEITPAGDLVRIGGKNGAGKSSVLDSIWYALGGKPKDPKPVRDGAEGASVSLTLDHPDGEIVVTRRWAPSGSTTLEIRREGMKFTSPQQALDAIVGRLAFDPLEFARATDTERVKMLLDAGGETVAKAKRALDAARQAANANNAALRDAERDLSRVPVPRPETPDEPIGVADLLEQVRSLNEDAQHRREAQQQMTDARAEVGAIDREIIVLNERLATVRGNRAALERVFAEARERLEATADPAPQIEDLHKQMGEAAEVNKRVEQKAQYAKLSGALEQARESAGRTSAEVRAKQKALEGALASAAFGVRGLAVDDGVVSINGIPFGQAAQAERLILSAHVAAALAGDVKVMLIRDGSLLDEDNMARLAEFAHDREFQVWLECVGPIEGGIIMEDGAVKEVARAE